MVKYLYYKSTLNTKNGDMQPNTNKTIPIIKLGFLSSIIPDIIMIIPRNPKITGTICEKSVLPVIAILSHTNL